MISSDQFFPPGQRIASWFRLNRRSDSVSDLFFELAERGMPCGTDEQILTWLEKRDEEGDLEATTVLANIYATGKVRPLQMDRGAALYRKAADGGIACAQYWLGICYEMGEGVPGSTRKAAAWYRKAAEQGDMPACVRLGLMYRCGNGVPRSSEEAVRWLTVATDKGYVPACCILAEMYEQGDGVPRSKEMAYEWYRKAADNAGEELTRELILEKIRKIKDAGRYARERRALQTTASKAFLCLLRKYSSGSWNGPSITRSHPLGKPSSSVDTVKGVRDEKSERVMPSNFRSSLNLR